MMNLRGAAIGYGLALGLAVARLGAQQDSQQQPERLPQTGIPTQTLQVGTQLVVLDATVFDHAGKIVTQVLGKDDFLIEEDKQPQVIRNFEAPPEHMNGANDAATTDKLPRTIVVLDELNSHYTLKKTTASNIMDLLSQQVYVRYGLIAFLRLQPAELRTPMEVLILTHHGYRLLAPTTRDRDQLIALVQKHDPGLGSPFRDFLEQKQGDFTLSKGSMAGLWSLALDQRSQPGRKNVLWLGWGGPSYDGQGRVDPKHMTAAERYIREITDLLVAARITLNVMGPGGNAGQPNATTVEENMQDYNFEDNFGFSGYVAATGGQMHNGNDIAAEIETAEDSGSQYYTMTYRPEGNNFDGRFRRIRVTVKGHPDWTVLTKAGYYAIQFGGEKDAEHELQSDLSIATFEAMPFHAIGAKVVSVQRVRGTDTARFILQFDPNDLEWHTEADAGKREADVVVSAAALGSIWAKAPLKSEVGLWKLTTLAQPDKSSLVTRVTVTAHIPPKMQRLRFVVRDMSNGRMGTVDEMPATIASAPVIDPTTPLLQPRALSISLPK